MIGYMANYAGPRIGEVIRAGNVSRRVKLPFTGVFGTVFVERILDMAAFGLFLLTIPLIFRRQTAELWHLLSDPLWAFYDQTNSVWIIGLGALGLAFVIFLWVAVPKIARNPKSKVLRYFNQFRDGVLSAGRTGKPLKMTILTLAMWLCYGLMAYLPFVLLGLDLPFHIGPVEAWGIMLIGAFGVIIPSPGGIGTFHFVTIQSLGMLFAMPNTDAATYALLVHSGQMLLYLFLGTLGILYLGTIPEQLVPITKMKAAKHE